MGIAAARILKGWLARAPRLFAFLHRNYYSGLRVIEHRVLGTKLHEWSWQIRPVDGDLEHAVSHPHRLLLVERIARFAPFGSVLEVGCHIGSNLLILARSYPGIWLYGMDINARAIAIARKMMEKEGVHNASVFVGKADDLRRLGDGSVDVAFTDATLMYVGPDKIMRTLAELTRVARKGVICNEWHLFGEARQDVLSRWYAAHWIHEYRALLTSLPRVKNVRIDRLPRGLYGPGGWEVYGALVEAELGSAEHK